MFGKFQRRYCASTAFRETAVVAGYLTDYEFRYKDIKKNKKRVEYLLQRLLRLWKYNLRRNISNSTKTSRVFECYARCETVKVWFGLGTKITQLSLEKDHDLG